jgi:hypothetical protein
MRFNWKAKRNWKWEADFINPDHLVGVVKIVILPLAEHKIRSLNP